MDLDEQDDEDEFYGPDFRVPLSDAIEDLQESISSAGQDYSLSQLAAEDEGGGFYGMYMNRAIDRHLGDAWSPELTLGQALEILKIKLAAEERG